MTPMDLPPYPFAMPNLFNSASQALTPSIPIHNSQPKEPPLATGPIDMYSLPSLYQSSQLTSQIPDPIGPHDLLISTLLHPRQRSGSKQAKSDDVDLQIIFTQNSQHPNPYLRDLLYRILLSPFYRQHRLEPTLDSSEGATILAPLSSFRENCERKSIYAAFLDIKEKRCLICGNKKNELGRLIGCVRSHLEHQPFPCLGEAMCCHRCKDATRYAVSRDGMPYVACYPLRTMFELTVITESGFIRRPF